MGVDYEDFVQRSGRALRAALVAAYGPESGSDAASDAIAYGWEHWDRVGAMVNPAGYLYRVGQTAARRSRRKVPRLFPDPPPQELPEFEPALLPSLEALTEPQRVCVVLVYAYAWTHREAAEVLDVSPETVRTHLARGRAHLLRALETSTHGT